MIFLTNEETEYLLALLNKQPSWWVKDRIIEKIEENKDTKKLMRCCEHTIFKYKGEKFMCSKCGATTEQSFKKTRIKQETPRTPLEEEYGMFAKR